ncbi:MAG: metal-sensing transcriptional repressor [Bacillota bacterium]|nr:metal-sensing transcriptional repressor [Bacillota bacterium]
MKEDNCCACKHNRAEGESPDRSTIRPDSEYKQLMNRLSRIEGQIKGIRGMLEKDAYCTDIITQVSAVNAALNAFNRQLLTSHIKGCVTRDILEGREDSVEDLLTTLQKLMK